MTWASLSAFAVAMTALCVVPGPAVLLVVSQALRHGSAKAVWSILGITAAGTMWFVLSATGIGAVLAASHALFSAVKWIGVAYLLWLGASAFWRSSKLATVTPAAGSARAGRLFWGGVVLQMANPSVMLFFAAFLPQFIAPKAPLVPQLAVFAVTTAVIEIVVQLGYALLAGQFCAVLTAPRFAKWTERVAGSFLIAAGLAMATSVAHADPASSSATYEELIAKAEAGEAVDFTALRHAYPASPGYAPYSQDARTLFIESFQAFDGGDCAAATAKAKKSLAIDYTNFAAHGFLSDCLERAGDHAGAEREEGMRKGFLDSLRGSGDGKSVETAYVIVSMAEERALLAINGVEEEQQALLTKGDRQFDEITGHGEDHAMHTLYFDITEPFAGLGRELEKGKGDSK